MSNNSLDYRLIKYKYITSILLTLKTLTSNQIFKHLVLKWGKYHTIVFTNNLNTMNKVYGWLYFRKRQTEGCLSCNGESNLYKLFLNPTQLTIKYTINYCTENRNTWICILVIMDLLSTLEYTEEKSLVVIVPFNYIALNTKYLIISILMVIIKLILNRYKRHI